jgi:hypothetical protein
MSDVVAPVADATAPIQGVTDAAAPEVQPAAEPKDFLAPKFAALTRKEKQIREYERSLKAKETELQAKFADYETKSKSTANNESQLLAKLKSNPLKFMTEHGLTFEQLTEMQLNNENPTTEMQMAQMRADLEAKMEEKYSKLNESLRQKEEREEREAVERAETGFKSSLNEFVSANPEKYELITANAATELMFDTAKAFYEETKRVPSFEEIADAVEAHLEEQATALFKLKKFQKLQPQTAPKPSTTQAAPTLSNTLAAEVPKSGTSKLSEEQSMELAAKMLRWNS